MGGAPRRSQVVRYRLIGIVRNWLKNVRLLDAVVTARIASAFTDFIAQNYDSLTAKGFSPADVEALPISELVECMERWGAVNR